MSAAVPGRARATFPNIASYVGVPIVVGDRFYGTLCAVDPVARPISDDAVKLLIVLARLLATQLERDQELAARYAAERELRYTQRRLERIYAVMDTGICVVDTVGYIVQVNRAFAEMHGKVEQELIGKLVYHLIPAELISGNEPRQHQLSNELYSNISLERQAVRDDGKYVEMQITVVTLPSGDGPSVRMIVTTDITERKRQERHLLHLSERDHLTGLANRRAFEKTLAEIVAILPTTAEHVVLFIDLDRFKQVNDLAARGHTAGDEALLWVAEIISEQLRPSDLVARVGGDEFAVLLRNTSMTQADKIAERLRQTIAATPFVTDGQSFSLSLSCGLVSVSNQAEANTVMLAADTAMYLAKQQGGNRIVSFGDEGRT